MTATLTATAAADTSGPGRTRVPVTWFYRAGVRPCPRVPTTTDQKATERTIMGQQCDEHTEDCPRLVVWRWRDSRRPSEAIYLCDKHAADKDLSQLEDLISPNL